MTLGDDIDRILGEHFTDWQKELLKDGLITDPNYAVPPIHDEGLKLITVNKIAGYFEVPVELLDETTSETTSRPSAPWHKRARWRWQAWRHVAGVRVGSLIAGFDLSHDYDYD